MIDPVDLITAYIFPIELLLATLVYMFPLPKRKRYIRRFLAGIFAYFISVSLYNSMRFSTDGDWANTISYILFCLLAFLLAAAVTLFCCNIALVDAIHCAAFAYATQHIAYCLHRIAFHVNDPTSLDRYSMGYFVVYATVYLAFYRIFAKEIIRVKSSDNGWRLSIRYTLGTLLVTLALSMCSQYFEQESQPLYTITMMYAMFCCTVLLYSQLYQFRMLNLQNELNLQQRLWQERKTQYELSRENIELINQKCHDLKHQIGALRAMADGAERETKLNELEQSVMIYDSIVETGNSTIDTVLTEKSLICERDQIVLTCIADGQCLNFMDVIDLYTILGNLLDNAIECVRELKNPQKRVISISIFSRANLIFIQCENYYEGEITLVNDLPKSTKTPDGYHGYGLKGVRQTAEKYGGFLTLDTTNHVFLVRTTIPAPNS